MKAVSLTASLALALACNPASAAEFVIQTDEAQSQTPSQEARLEQFTPRWTGREMRLDYSIWGVALRSMVVGMGPSLRKGAMSREAYTGSRLMRGHSSLYRLEGNRIAYSFLDEKVIASFTEYREDLERIGSEIDIPSLPRNEQLAFWFNLHNVAVIEQIALNYPVVEPSRMEVGGVPLDEAKLVTIAGIQLSPRDIRTRIVYPNWSDPRVIYGFFRGDIGSPAIQREEFNAENLTYLLDDAAREFVNALRGTERRGRTLHVSRIYEEAAPYYFPEFGADLRAHLTAFAKEEVQKHLTRTETFRPTIYERDIADLAGGERQSNFFNVVSSNRDGERVLTSFRIPLTVQFIMAERSEKIRQLTKRGERLWTITVRPIALPGEEKKIQEIE